MAADYAAQALGIQPGLALAEAQARLPGLLIAPGDPTADAAGLERLALWALRRYSPVVAIDPPDGLLIDTTGVAHLFGGEAALLDDLCTRLSAARLGARVALADTIGAAHALARFGPHPTMIAAPGETNAAVAALPLASLRLDPIQVERLDRQGLPPGAPLAIIFFFGLLWVCRQFILCLVGYVMRIRDSCSDNHVSITVCFGDSSVFSPDFFRRELSTVKLL
jgi:protein ImuB